MVKCVAFGCKSGYKSQQKSGEKNHFFMAPNDQTLLKQWQIGIFRDDFIIKPGHAVCEKHFKQEDIVRKRFLYAPDGVTVVGISPYKRPKLKEGAFPVLQTDKKEPRRLLKRCQNEDLNSSSPKNVKTVYTKIGNSITTPKESTIEINFKEEPPENEFVDPSLVNFIPNIKVKNLSTIEETGIETCFKKEISPDNEFNECVDPLSDSPPIDLFNKLFDNKEAVPLPTSWSKANLECEEDKQKAITFFKLIGRKDKNGRLESVCEKEIIIDEKMTTVMKINGTYCDYRKLGVEVNEIVSVNKLIDIIEILDKCEICQGCPDITCTPIVKDLMCPFSHLDNNDTIRHNNCTLVLTTENEKENFRCKYCKTVKELLKQKQKRREKLLDSVRAKKRKLNVC